MLQSRPICQHGGRAAALAAALAIALCSRTGLCTSTPGLPSLASVNSSDLTVSGISAGGFMAVQMHVAHSSRLRGAGILAAGPFFCAQGLIQVALTSCMTAPALISVDELELITANTEATLTIDRTSNMKHSRVWIWSGTADTVVNPGVVRKLELYYGRYVTQPGFVSAEYGVPSEHAFPTTSYGNNCSYRGEPYINNCNYDAAGTMLQHLYFGKLHTPGSADAPHAGGALLTFDQRPFLPQLGVGVGMQDTGYIYVPSRCGAGGGAPTASCGLHIALHGCLQTTDLIGTQYVEHTGLLPWAEANDLVVLFPQAKASLVDPRGCWDWWGFTGADYACKLGVQQRAIMAMVDHILAKVATTETANGPRAEGLGALVV